jgi:hypothetical protein
MVSVVVRAMAHLMAVVTVHGIVVVLVFWRASLQVCWMVSETVLLTVTWMAMNLVC